MDGWAGKACSAVSLGAPPPPPAHGFGSASACETARPTHVVSIGWCSPSKTCRARHERAGVLHLWLGHEHASPTEPMAPAPMPRLGTGG
jgi:hypothetical protein